MRVSSGQMSTNYLRQLNNAYAKQQKLMEKTDGSDLHRPSDNPVQCVRTLLYQNSLVQNEQYTQNLKDAVSWMTNTDSTMNQIAEQLKTIVERTVDGATGTNSLSDMQGMAKEVTELINQIMTLANGQLGDRYIFSGQADKTKPYPSDANGAITQMVTDRGDLKALDEDQAEVFGVDRLLTLNGSDDNTYYVNYKTGDIYTSEYVNGKFRDDTPANAAIGNIGAFDVSDYFGTDGKIGGTAGMNKGDVLTTVNGVSLSFSVSDQTVVDYKGDFNKISMPIQNGGAQPESDSVNMTGEDLFGSDIFGEKGSALMNDLLLIRDKLNAGDSHWLSETGITLANNAHNYIINKESEVGGRLASYALTQAMMEDKNAVIKGDISNASDAKVDEVITDLQMAGIVYRLSLSVGSKILPPSLADYL